MTLIKFNLPFIVISRLFKIPGQVPLKQKTIRFATDGSVEVVFLYLLYPEVSKSLVGFGHTMGIFFLFECGAFAF